MMTTGTLMTSEIRKPPFEWLFSVSDHFDSEEALESKGFGGSSAIPSLDVSLYEFPRALVVLVVFSCYFHTFQVFLFCRLFMHIPWYSRILFWGWFWGDRNGHERSLQEGSSHSSLDRRGPATLETSVDATGVDICLMSMPFCLLQLMSLIDACLSIYLTN
jgi:hypothetical protein